MTRYRLVRDDYEFHTAKEHDHDVGRENSAPKPSSRRVVYVERRFTRSVSSAEVAVRFDWKRDSVQEGACWHKPCHGPFTLPYARRLVQFVEKTAAIVTFFTGGLYSCVQWRSETRATVNKTFKKRQEIGPHGAAVRGGVGERDEGVHAREVNGLRQVYLLTGTLPARDGLALPLRVPTSAPRP